MRKGSSLARALCAACFALAVAGCQDGDMGPVPEAWSWVARSESAAFMSVHGTAGDDVWFSGADDGTSAVVLHWDGLALERRDPGVRADLWWVNAVAGGPVFFGGSEGTLLRYERGVFERIATPRAFPHTVFGVWAAAPDDVYAVGSAAGRSGFIWHFDGAAVTEVPLPAGLPLDPSGEAPGFLKVWGLSPRDVWVVGSKGVVLRGSAEDGFRIVRAGGSDTFFTVYGRGDQIVVVGGSGTGVVLEGRGGMLTDRTPPSAPLLQGASIDASGRIWAVGVGGSMYMGQPDALRPVDTGLAFSPGESLHAIWVDPGGGVWSAGGNVLSPKLDRGVALHGAAELLEVAR